jgi:transposase-like protein
VPKPYPPEFRRRALDLVASGRSVREVATMLGIAESCLHRWKSRDLVDRGLKSPTPEQAESAAFKAARERIVELGNEVKILRKARRGRGGGAPKSTLRPRRRTGR